jgi:hypothetical protein
MHAWVSGGGRGGVSVLGSLKELTCKKELIAVITVGGSYKLINAPYYSALPLRVPKTNNLGALNAGGPSL